jgi:hypothetical protein
MKNYSVIHGLADALTAIEKAKASNTTIDLITAPDASSYLGPAMFKTIVDEIRKSAGATVASIYYDCGDRRGDVMAGLRVGLTQLCLIDSALTPAILDLAAQHGATVIPRPS